MRIIFAGTGEYSSKHLYCLLSLKDQCEVVGVLTKFNKLFGRSKRKNLNLVKVLSEKFYIPLIELQNLNSKRDIDWIRNKKADMMIVVSFGLIFQEFLIDMFPLGCFNFHASLLPRWRGPSPVQYSILFGDRKTGVTLIKLNNKLDSGFIVDQISIPVDKNDNIVTLLKKLLLISVNMLKNFILLFFNKKRIILRKQDNKLITYSKKFIKRDGLINWNLPAIQVQRYINAFYIWPGSYFYLKKKLVKIKKSKVVLRKNCSVPGKILSVGKNGIEVNTNDNILVILEIQIQDKKRMSVKDFLNSNKNMFVSGDVIS